MAYTTQDLSSTEKLYPAQKLEFLGLKWTVSEKFPDYMYGAKFLVRTENNPLTYIKTPARLDAIGQQWLAALSAYDFQLQYRPDCNNIDADALSRRPYLSMKKENEWVEIPSPAV